jgi:hypothetical protein
VPIGVVAADQEPARFALMALRMPVAIPDDDVTVPDRLLSFGGRYPTGSSLSSATSVASSSLTVDISSILLEAWVGMLVSSEAEAGLCCQPGERSEPVHRAVKATTLV